MQSEYFCTAAPLKINRPKENEKTQEKKRKRKKRDFRALWIERIGAATRMHGMTYSAFIGGLNKAEIPVNRKMLADLAVRDPEAFQGFVEKAREQLQAV